MYLLAAVVLAGLAVGCGSNTPIEGVPPSSTSSTVASSSAPDRSEEAIKALSEKGIVPLNPVWDKQRGVLTFGMAETVCTGEYYPGTAGTLPILTIRRAGVGIGSLFDPNITFEKLRTDPSLGICWQF